MLNKKSLILTVALALVITACGGDDDVGTSPLGLSGSQSSNPGSPPASAPPSLPSQEDPEAFVVGLLEDAGLEVCDVLESGGGPTAYSGAHISVAEPPCAGPGDPEGPDGEVSFDLYNDPEVAAAEIVTPTSDSPLVWLVDPTTTASTGSTNWPEVQEAIEQAFDGYPRWSES